MTIQSRDDRGAVSVMVGLMFSTCVFFVMLAFAVDWGMINWERAQVQRSADAATSALAWKCAAKLPACATATAAASFAKTVADANASDGKMSIKSVCGRGGAGQTWLVSCANPPSGATNYVRVETGSLSTFGGFIQLPFTGVIDKTEGANRAVVTSTAQASWTVGGVLPAFVMYPAGAVGATTTLGYRQGNRTGDGYTVATSPNVSGCSFTSLPATGSAISLSNAAYAGSGASGCVDAVITSGSPIVALVSTSTTRKTASQWRSLTTLTKSGQNIIVKWGAVITSTAPVVTVLP